jgi:site-specific recombinase XerD
VLHGVTSIHSRRSYRTGLEAFFAWLMKDQANHLRNASDPQTLTGKRDRAILAVLLGCGLRRAELLCINVADLQQREGRWVLPDLTGKRNRIRTVTVPAAGKARVDAWLSAAGITTGRISRFLR